LSNKQTTQYIFDDQNLHKNKNKDHNFHQLELGRHIPTTIQQVHKMGSLCPARFLEFTVRRRIVLCGRVCLLYVACRSCVDVVDFICSQGGYFGKHMCIVCVYVCTKYSSSLSKMWVILLHLLYISNRWLIIWCNISSFFFVPPVAPY
jgi:hypothetical protein